ncbi:MAG: DUF952 domain-containing protein [Pseudomonadota bacterium]
MAPSQTLFHLTPAAVWQDLSDDDVYFPATYEKDGFIHATSDASVLINIANHFYKEIDGDWLCLETTVAIVEAAGIRVLFEAPAPVGEKAPDIPGVEEGQRFPHIFGGLRREMISAVHTIERADDGTFLAIVGI